MHCYILAAGEASRMFPLNSILEKSLLPVDGIPVIRHIYNNLKKSGKIDKIVISCLDKFKKNFQHEFRDAPDVYILPFEKPIGTYLTFYSAILPSYNIPAEDEYAMLHYADCLTDIDYTDFISKIDTKFDGIIAVTNTVRHDYSEVLLQDNTTNVVFDFYEKPKLQNYTWSGIGIFNIKNIQKYHRESYYYEKSDFAQDIFPQMIEKNKLKAYPYHGYWYDMGNLNSYRKVSGLNRNNNT